MDPGSTPEGQLPPLEVLKAIAFNDVIEAMEKHTGKTCWELLGKSKKQFTADRLKVVGGGKPSARAVQKHWTKKKQDKDWYPGKGKDKATGRPAQISQSQKQAIADKAMELKKKMVIPTPENVRICLPKKTINKATQEPISDNTFWRVYQSMCYDEKEDDPWQYLPSIRQDCLTKDMLPARIKTADHVLQWISEGSAWNFVAIDPCLTLLPRQQSKADQLKIYAMGHHKWMSKKSRRKGVNPRAPNTTTTQKKDCVTVPWTPVFARGCLKLVVLTEHKATLNSSDKVADFVKNRLPAVLNKMKDEFHWTTVPRVVLHDKASYFVDNNQNRVNTTFAAGLRAGGFKSWVADDTRWLASHLGDFYPHETVISHVRRLLQKKFRKDDLYETPQQFAARMLKVERYMNYEMGEGGSLEKLGQALHSRAQQLKDLRGERLPK